MEQIVEKNKCTGCTACMSSCPAKAIEMIDDENGFKHPVINQEKCINCGLCKRKCPVLNTSKNSSLNNCYVGYNKDEKSLMDSASSGSIFELVANYILDQNGVVVGAAFDEDMHLKHVAVENKNELDKLKGSKYLQSDLNNTFSYIKDKVKSQKVLFVGTPCQVAGIKAFIKSDNLICIDLFCHGVPSPKLFNKYLDELEKKHKDKVLDYDFRDKCTGWDTYSNSIYFHSKFVTENKNKNDYMKLFLSDVALRESCYNCNFKLGNKYSDITLGDFWGINNYYPEMYNKKGVSAIIINTELGQAIFDAVCKNMEYKQCKLEEIVSGNPSLKESCKYNNKRELFFKDIDDLSIDKLTKKYSKKNNIIKRIIKKLVKIIKK